MGSRASRKKRRSQKYKQRRLNQFATFRTHGSAALKRESTTEEPISQRTPVLVEPSFPRTVEADAATPPPAIEQPLGKLIRHPSAPPIPAPSIRFMEQPQVNWHLLAQESETRDLLNRVRANKSLMLDQQAREAAEAFEEELEESLHRKRAVLNRENQRAKHELQSRSGAHKPKRTFVPRPMR